MCKKGKDSLKCVPNRSREDEFQKYYDQRKELSSFDWILIIVNILVGVVGLTLCFLVAIFTWNQILEDILSNLGTSAVAGALLMGFDYFFRRSTLKKELRLQFEKEQPEKRVTYEIMSSADRATLARCAKHDLFILLTSGVSHIDRNDSLLVAIEDLLKDPAKSKLVIQVVVVNPKHSEVLRNTHKLPISDFRSNIRLTMMLLLNLQQTYGEKRLKLYVTDSIPLESIVAIDLSVNDQESSIVVTHYLNGVGGSKHSPSVKITRVNDWFDTYKNEVIHFLLEGQVIADNDKKVKITVPLTYELLYCLFPSRPLDMHVHSTFSHDSKLKLADAVQEAVLKNLTDIYFTEHINYRASELAIKEYLCEIDDMRAKYKDRIRIHAGIEFNYLQANIKEFKEFLLEDGSRIDYIVNSVHEPDTAEDSTNFLKAERAENYYDKIKVTTEDEKKALYQNYLEDVLRSINVNYQFDTLGHLGFIHRNPCFADFNYQDHQVLVDLYQQILSVLIKKDIRLEINTYGSKDGFLLPDSVITLYKELIDRTPNARAKFSFGSDAHANNCLAVNFDGTIKKMANLKFHDFLDYILD